MKAVIAFGQVLLLAVVMSGCGLESTSSETDGGVDAAGGSGGEGGSGAAGGSGGEGGAGAAGGEGGAGAAGGTGGEGGAGAAGGTGGTGAAGGAGGAGGAGAAGGAGGEGGAGAAGGAGGEGGAGAAGGAGGEGGGGAAGGAGGAGGMGPMGLSLHLDTSCSGIENIEEVRLTGPWWGWDPVGGPVGADEDGDGIYTVTLDDVPDSDLQYKWVINGEFEATLTGDPSTPIGACTAFANPSGNPPFANRIHEAGSGERTDTWASCVACGQNFTPADMVTVSLDTRCVGENVELARITGPGGVGM